MKGSDDSKATEHQRSLPRTGLIRRSFFLLCTVEITCITLIISGLARGVTDGGENPVDRALCAAVLAVISAGHGCLNVAAHLVLNKVFGESIETLKESRLRLASTVLYVVTCFLMLAAASARAIKTPNYGEFGPYWLITAISVPVAFPAVAVSALYVQSLVHNIQALTKQLARTKKAAKILDESTIAITTIRQFLIIASLNMVCLSVAVLFLQIWTFLLGLAVCPIYYWSFRKVALTHHYLKREVDNGNKVVTGGETLNAEWISSSVQTKATAEISMQNST